MPGSLAYDNSRPYLRIVGGNIVRTVDKDTQGARFREYEKKDGTMGGKWELVYADWEGIIRKFTFKDGDYGETCNIEFDDAILVISTASRYFTDFACRIMSADLTKPVILHPFDMETESGKKTGVSVKQDEIKLKNAFWDGEKLLGGFPPVDEAKKEKKSYWKGYFAEVEEFLIGKLKELKIGDSIKIVDEAYDEKQSAGGVPDDLPF